jgi:hypothetical protein
MEKTGSVGSRVSMRISSLDARSRRSAISSASVVRHPTGRGASARKPRGLGRRATPLCMDAIQLTSTASRPSAQRLVVIVHLALLVLARETRRHGHRLVDGRHDVLVVGVGSSVCLPLRPPAPGGLCSRGGFRSDRIIIRLYLDINRL